MFEIEKFLFAFDLDIGGVVIGWLSIIFSIFYIIAFSGTLGFLLLAVITRREVVKEHTGNFLNTVRVNTSREFEIFVRIFQG